MYDVNVIGKCVPSTMPGAFFTNALFRNQPVCQPGLTLKEMSPAVLDQLPN